MGIWRSLLKRCCTIIEEDLERIRGRRSIIIQEYAEKLISLSGKNLGNLSIKKDGTRYPVFRKYSLTHGVYIINGIEGIWVERVNDPDNMKECLPFNDSEDNLQCAGPSFTIRPY